MTQQVSDLINRLRSIRTEANRLRASLIGDLGAFQKKDHTFFTLPNSKRDGISVATTCTAVMALLGSDRSFLLFREGDEDEDTSKQEVKQRIKKLFTSVVEASWRSSDLEDLNAFTTSMVIRAAGFLVRAGILSSAEAYNLKHKRPPAPTGTDEKNPPGVIGQALGAENEPTLRQIVKAVIENVPKSLGIPKYPPKLALAYWFIDGANKAGFDIPYEYWEKIADWAAKQFNKELSYVDSGNDALMDPSSLAMAACVVRRAKKICAEGRHFLI